MKTKNTQEEEPALERMVKFDKQDIPIKIWVD